MKVLQITDLKLAEHARISYRAFVEPDVTIEDIQKPEFWGNVANSKFNHPTAILTEVQVVWKDNSRVVDLFVVGVADNAALVHIKHVTELHSGNSVVETKAGEFEIRWGGPKALWRVYRKSDGAIVSELNKTKEHAQESLDDYLSRITKVA